MSRMSLPPGWTLATLDDLLAPLEDGRTLHHGWSPQCEMEASRSDEEWGVLKTTAVQDGAFLPEHNKRLPKHLTPRPHLEVKPGDILITCAGPRARCGVTCLVRHTRPRLIISGKMYRFRVPDSFISVGFAETSLRTPEARTAIDRMKTGISDSGLNLTHEKFRKLSIMVAPLPEQRRIVEAVESYFTRLDDVLVTLEMVQRNLKRHRGALLKAAVEGRLVPTEAELARAECRDYEPASALMERILSERRRRWERSGRKRYAEPSMPDPAELPELPNGWCWTTAEAISDPMRPITYGVIKLGEEVEDGIPILRSSNVRHLRLDLEYTKPIAERIEAGFRRTRLRGHEVLVTVRGTLGGVAVAPETCRDFNISREVAMISLIDERLAPTVATFIASPNLQAWMLRRTRGITYQGVNIETLKALPIPLPPLEEQRRIVYEVGRKLSVAEAASAAAHRNVLRCGRLRQSILKYAFEGKLVAQDLNDEPASVLLERIRAARAAALPTGKERRANGGPRTTA